MRPVPAKQGKLDRPRVRHGDHHDSARRQGARRRFEDRLGSRQVFEDMPERNHIKLARRAQWSLWISGLDHSHPDHIPEEGTGPLIHLHGCYIEPSALGQVGKAACARANLQQAPTPIESADQLELVLLMSGGPCQVILC